METGPHGVYQVALSQGSPVQADFLPMAQVEWCRLEVDVSECSTVADVQERIVSAQFAANADACCQRMIFRVILTGKTSLHSRLDARVLDDLRQAVNDSYPFFFIDDIWGRTSVPFNKEALRTEGLFPAAYLGALDEYRKGDAAALQGVEDEFCRRDLPLPKTLGRAMPSLCDEAETLVLDLLGREA